MAMSICLFHCFDQIFVSHIVYYYFRKYNQGVSYSKNHTIDKSFHSGNWRVGGLIVTIFFGDDCKRIIIVHRQHNKQLIQSCFVASKKPMSVIFSWMELPIKRINIELMRFLGRLISRKSIINWPPAT